MHADLSRPWWPRAIHTCGEEDTDEVIFANPPAAGNCYEIRVRDRPQKARGHGGTLEMLLGGGPSSPSGYREHPFPSWGFLAGRSGLAAQKGQVPRACYWETREH